MAMLNDVMGQLAAGDVFNPLGANMAAFSGGAVPQVAGKIPVPALPQADPMMTIQTLGAGAGNGPLGANGGVPGLPGGPQGAGRPNFGSYIPQGLVQMLMRLQAQNPERLGQLFGRQPGFMDRFGITPETDLANLYTRQMARQDFRGGTDPMAAGTVLTPEQRAGYSGMGGPGNQAIGMAAMRPWPQYAGGGMGNQAPQAGTAPAQGFAPNRPVGMAERKAPGAQNAY